MASKLGTLTLDLVCRVGNFTQAMREASSSASREMGRIESSTSSAQSMLKSLAATAAATFTVSQIVNYADSYTGMVNKLKLVTENQSQLNIAMSDTHKIAQSTASEWGGVVDVYTKFQKISDRLGLSQKEVARVTETVTKAVGMSGASADEAQRALIQFSQGLSLGVLRGQDLNSVMAQTPALTDAIAKGMGVTSDKLKQMGADNILTTESIVEALKKVAKSVDDEFADTATLVTASFDLIKNEAIKMIGEFDQRVGASKVFVENMTALSQNMDVVVGGLTVATAYMVGSYIPAIALGTKTLVVDTVAKVSSIAATRAKVLADYEVAKSNLAATAAMARSMGAINAQTAAMIANARAAYQQAAANKAAALSSATAFLGPVGLGIAVASVAAGYLLLKDSTDESTKSLRDNNESVDDAIAKYRELDEVRRDAQVVAEREQLKELAKSYDNATNSLITNAYALTRHNDVTAAQSKELNALIAEFKSTGDLENFTSKIKALTFINQQSKDKFVVLAGAVSKAGSEYKTQLSLIKEMVKFSPNAVKATDERTAAADREKKAIEAANKAYADYSKSAFADIKEMAARAQMQKMGFGDNQIAERLKVLKLLDYDPVKAHSQSGIEMKKLADISAKMKDDEEARNKALKDQNKEKEKQYQYSKKELELLRKAYSDVSKTGLGAYAESKGIPANMIAGLYMQESKAGTALKSHTGALGPWQTTTAYRTQHNISLSKNNDFLFVGKIVVDAISKELEKSGSLRQAILSHNAGPAGSKQFLDTGKVGGSPERNKEVAGYLPKIDKWASWGSGKKGDLLNSNNSGEAFEEYLEAYKKLQQDKAQFSQQFSSEDIVRNQERIDTIARANELGLQQYIPKIKDHYKAQGQLAHLYYLEDVEGYKWGEEQKIAHARLVDQQQLILSAKYTDAEKIIIKKAIDDRAAYELAVFDETQKRKAQELSDVLTEQQKQSSRNQLRFIAQATMNPSEYARWNLQNNMTDDMGYAFEKYGQDVNNINRKDESGRFEIEDANYRNQLLQQAERTHQAKMLEIKEEYAAQAKDLEKDQHESQLQLYGSLLSQASSVWDSMTQMVKDAKGENSKTFKAMFFMQQSMAIAQQIINTELAAGATTAQQGVFGIPAATAIRALGYASVGLIAGQTIAGMAHDGIDNIPREGTWLLDRGERVVDRRTNSDLKDYLKNGGSSNGDVHISVQVTDSGVSTQSNQSDQKQLGQMIGNAVRTVIMQEKRQGGLLAR